MRAILFLAVFVIYQAVAVPVPCDIADQFQVRSFTVILDDNGCATQTLFQDIFYDYPNQNIRVDQVSSIQGQAGVYSVWLLYSQQLQVVYDRTNEQCVVSALNGTLDPHVIPGDASYGGTILIGSQAVDVWSVPSQDDSELDGMVTITKGTCFITSQTVFNSTSGAVAFTGSYWDFVPSVPLFVFEFPSTCKTALIKKAAPSQMPKLKRMPVPVSPLENAAKVF